MRIKTLLAPTMPEALRMIREQLGPEALILGTRKVPGADGKPTLEITAALDEPEPTSRLVADPLPSIPASITPKTSAKPHPQPSSRDHSLSDILTQHGVTEPLVSRILTALPGLGGAGFSHAEALDMLLGRLASFKSWPDILAPGQAHVFIGPHGAGKTTLLSKLALHSRQQGSPVGLLSLDDQKIAGLEPLAVVAETLGDTAHLVTNAASLRTAMARLGSRSLILIDTPGLNPYQPQSLALLADKLAALNLPFTTHLVVPANLNRDDMIQLPMATQRFAPTSLVATRLDATSRLGALFSAAAQSGLTLGLSSNAPAVTMPPFGLTATWLAHALSQYPLQPWEYPA